MRASVTAARLKYRMRHMLFLASVAGRPHERLAARETLAAVRQSAGNELFQILPTRCQRSGAPIFFGSLRHRLAIECGNLTCGAALFRRRLAVQSRRLLGAG